MGDNLWNSHPELVAVLIVVNGLTAFSLTREFSLIFGGKPKPMTVRSPEGLWALVLPMTVMMGFALHVPILLQQWHLLPSWESLNLLTTGSLVLSTLIGSIAGTFIYLSDRIAKPIQLNPQWLQNFFAYDLYTPQLYRVTIVAVVAIISNVVNWFDQFIVDGVVNIVGIATLFGGQGLKYNVSGQGQFYIFTMFLGLAVLVSIFCFPLLS